MRTPAPSNAPAVSIIVPTYRTGPALQRVFDSVDALDFPVEVLFVDDGSAQDHPDDDTVARLRAFADGRPHVVVVELENSGWPSRPRNVAIERARGEYLLFMDHDDSLYPDGLRRAYEFAVAHDADVLSPKESKTNDFWWGMTQWREGNVANLHDGPGVVGLHPMIPHKLYRRQLLLDHGIRFPEGRRLLWEDWYINVPAYRHGAVVSVLADTPVYLWHASDENTSHTFDPARPDFWDRLADLFDHIDTTLDTDRFAEDRAVLIAHHVQMRVIHRLVRMLTSPQAPDEAAQDHAFARARELLARWGTPEVLARMPRKYRALAHLMTHASRRQVRDLQLAEEALTADVRTSGLRWDAGRLRFEAELRWTSTDTARARLVDDPGGLRLDVGPELAALVPAELLDLGEELAGLSFEVGVRSRRGHVTWTVPVQAGAAGPTPDTDGAAVVRAASVCLDLRDAAAGAPLTDEVWDLRFRSEFYGIDRRGPLHYAGRALPALVDGRPAVPYANNAGALSLDLAQELRTLATDAAPRPGPAGPVHGFRARLTELASTGPGRVDARLAVIPASAVPSGTTEPSGTIEPAGTGEQPVVDEAGDVLDKLAAEQAFDAEVVVDDAGAWLVGAGRLAAGDHHVYARRAGRLHRTRWTVAVDPALGVHLVTR